MRRALALTALMVLVIVVVIVALLLTTSTSHVALHLRTVAGHDAQDAINSLRSLIGRNTK